MSKQFVTYTCGEEKFSPVSYNSFTVGPFSMTLEVEDDETPIDALNRARKMIEGYMEKRFEKKRDAFHNRLMRSGRNGGPPDKDK